MSNHSIEITKKPSSFPCKDCQDRHAGCHSDCAAYKAAVDKNNERKTRAKKEIEKQLEYLRFTFQSIDRSKRRLRKKR